MASRRVVRPLLGLLILAAALLPRAAGAVPYFAGARALGMGGAYTALSDDNAALDFNPAGLYQTPAYTIDANYQRVEFFPTPDAEKKTRLDEWHTAVVDSATSQYVAAGVELNTTGSFSDIFKLNKGYRATLGLAFPGGSFMGVGASGRYIKVSKHTEVWTADVGALFTPTPFLHIGVAARNLVPQKRRAAEQAAPGELALGLSSSLYGFVTLASDATWTWDTETLRRRWNFHVGLEGVIAGQVAIRGGYFFDEVHAKGYYGVGLAYVNQNGSIAYTFQQNPGNLREFTHSVQVAIRFGGSPNQQKAGTKATPRR